MQTNIQGKPGGQSQAPQARPPSRMTLGAVKRGKINTPLRVLLYGTEGIGKTTWAASAPEPIFLCAEDGTAHLDVARLPEPRSWAEVFEAVALLEREAHEYKTLVIDTIDWLEPLAWRAVCDASGKTDIEAFGYGKGYVAALDEWRRLLAALERLRRARSMGIVFLAHSLIKTFKNPEGEDFDRYQLKLHEKAGGLVKEWCDAVLFAKYETFSIKKDELGKAKGVSSGARVVHTIRTAAWDAKNRHDLPETLPLSYEDFAASVASHRPADPAQLRADIATLRAQAAAGSIDDAALDAALAKSADDAAALARIKDRIAAKVAATVQAEKGE